MNNAINQNITFKDVANKSSLNEGTCSVDNCNGWGTHYSLVNLNGINVLIQFCKKHADEVENILSTSMSQQQYYGGLCAEESCKNPITRVGVMEVNGFSTLIPACEIHAKQIENVLLNGNEILKIPTFKCIPRDDFGDGMMFFCPYCQEWHKHGEGDGQRIAHCNREDSPLKETGYFIELIPYDELMEIREAIDSYLEFER